MLISDQLERDGPSARPGTPRRAFLSGIAAVATSAAFRAVAAEEPGRTEASPERIVVLDWGLAATVIALGVAPVGVPAIAYYTRNVVTPPMPENVVDVGLLFTPNYELLYELRADRILIPPELEVARTQLERICAVSSFSLRDRNGTSLEAAASATATVAADLGRRDKGQALIATALESLSQAQERLTKYAGRLFLLTSFVDDRHVAIFARGSLYDDVLRRLGLVNAWQASAGFGGRIIVGIERLADFPDSHVIVISASGRGLPKSAEGLRFWRALPFVATHRIIEIAPVYEQGGLPSIIRFATLVSTAIAKEGVDE
ncbi:ABC transporter substrate-binding protein [Rhizobium sp. SYY.PMSO]|uniref:ABC transporter substrate-binding protein n=1 Tax=Rhizobium sp. SYY.PMSO TaxID=3382192 RepID=UPI00398FC9B4